MRIKDFYSTLYKRRSTKGEEGCLEYLKTLKIPKLSDVERESCEGLLTKKECWDALQRMKNDKSPGSDGLTKEFYVCFFNEVSNTLIAALNHSFTTGMLSTSQRQAVITLIEKKGKDKRFMKIWRPIPLINVDTKIASKALAARKENVLTSIVHCNQTAYVKDRYIGESIRLITDLLAYTEENSIGGILFSADFEKAFDSVEHSFIFATLKSFGFGAQFIQWIRTIFNSTESCVINNCHSTGFFPLERGTRQGDPLSAFLFILCLETLFIQIRDNESIKGININTYQIKLSAYADDADFLASDAMSLELILQTCANFQTFSSLKLNVEKCEACWIGAEKDNPAKPINCKWVNIASEAIRTLGIYNSYDTDLVEKLNFLDNLKPLNDVIRTWEPRGLSLAGKILVFKTLAVSKLLYVCTFKIRPHR